MTAAVDMSGWDYMETNFKVEFDPINKIITVADGITALSVKHDLYSDWKEWVKLRDNSKYAEFAMRTIGGDPTIPGQFAGDMYFMINGWRVAVDFRKTQVTGILFSDDYDTPWLNKEDLQPLQPAVVSNLVLTVQPSLEGLDIPTSEENATAVWDDSRALTKPAFLALK